MRAFDRDLIRGGHYGQRSCEPHPKAEHMAAPTNAANVKKALANSEPSTHGTNRKCQSASTTSARGGNPDGICSLRAFPLMSSRPEESHPRALPDPCMNLSIHTA